jgi:YbbR domain-containing protein
MALPAMKRPMRPPLARVKLIRATQLKRRYSPEALLKSLQQNLGLRIISLLLAIGLWIFVNAGQHTSVHAFSIPISYRGLPPGFVITNEHPDFVKMQISGPQTLLSLVDPTRLTLKLDLSGVGVGQASFKIGLESFNVPRGTAVTSITPSQIVLDVDKIVIRYLPVHVVTIGTPADGYRIGSIESTPPRVKARAPSRQLAGLEAVDTEAVDISGATSDTQRDAAITLPSGSVRIEPSEVMVKVTLASVIVNKDFRAVPVIVHDSAFQSTLLPPRINLTLRGPKLELAKLDLGGAVFVDGDGLEPGAYNTPVQVQLPPGVELLHLWPDKVRIIIKRAAHG